MIRATKVIRAGRWSGVSTDAVVLTHEDRYRRRLAMKGKHGLEFLLDLPEATQLRHGDGLVLEDGRMVEVHAKPEELMQVSGRDPHHLARLAWHLGNRHVPVAIGPERIYMRPDRVLADMLGGLGAEVTDVEAPFEPESGAYDAHGHDHAHDDAPHDGKHSDGDA